MAKESTWQLYANAVSTLSLLPQADKFERLYNESRGHGNSKLLCFAIDQKGGTLVCATDEQAQTAKAHAKMDNQTIHAVALGGSIKGAVAVDMSAIIELVREAQRLAAASRELLEYGRQKGVWT